MTTSLSQAYHTFLQTFFGNDSERLAKACGFVQRRSPITGSLFLRSLVWSAFHQRLLTLSGIAATAEQLDPACRLSPQAFPSRFTPQAVAFLQAMFALALQQRLPHPHLVLPLVSTFSAVYLLDSSQVTFPDTLQEQFAGCGGDGPRAAAKIYFLLNWLTGSYAAIEIGDGKKVDQNRGRDFLADKPSGALWIMDLGFWNVEYLGELHQRGSYFLCRLQSQTAVSVEGRQGEWVRLDVDRFLSLAPRDQDFEMTISLGRKQSVTCRLIGRKVSDAVAAARRRRARAAARRRGRTITQRHLRRQSWALFVTNARPQQLATSAIEAVYAIRWQVELAFKLAKSEAGLDKSNSGNGCRVVCEFYARLIALMLFDDLLAVARQGSQESLSPVKAWRSVRDKLWQWGRGLLSVKGGAVLQEVVEYLRRRAKTDRRKKYPSTKQKVERALREGRNRVLVKPLEYVKMRKKGGGMSSACFFSDSNVGSAARLA